MAKIKADSVSFLVTDANNYGSLFLVSDLTKVDHFLIRQCGAITRHSSARHSYRIFKVALLMLPLLVTHIITRELVL